MSFQTIRYERPTRNVARVMLARPERRNAQNTRMLYEVNDAFDLAGQDNQVKVLILAADGDDFSSGHDLEGLAPLGGHAVVGTWGGSDLPGVEGWLAYEQEL